MLQIVIPLHHAGGKEKTNSELRYALRGWHACLGEPFAVTLIGRRLPAWLTGVRHIPQEKGGLKNALRIAAKEFPQGFLWAYDDTFPIHPTTGDLLRQPVARSVFSQAWQTSWSKALGRIHDRLVAEGIPPLDFSRPHCPYWFDASMIEEAFADWPAMSAKFPFETWILSKRRVPHRTGVEKQYYGAFKTPPKPHHHFVNCSDAGWTPELKAWLAERFPAASPFEKTERAVYFVHIPKTAGKSLIAAFGDQLVRAHPHRHRTWRDKRNLKAWNDSGCLPVAACVRCPIDRAISTYHFWKIYSFPRRDVHQIQLQKLARRTDLSTFWETLDLAKAAAHIRHFKTQSEFLRGATITHLLRYETLEEDFRRLAAALGKPAAELPHENAAPRDAQTLTPAAEARIREFYTEDFAQWYPHS